MNNSKAVKAKLLEMLDESIDPNLLGIGFKRRKGSFVYKRKLVDSVQEIEFLVNFFPRYGNSADAHIQPFFIWKIPSISEEALKLVNDNKVLLANAPDLILKQPIEVCAPTESHERWFAKKQEDYSIVGSTICSFIQRWLISFLDDVKGIDDLIRMYELSDSRLLKQQHWYVYVVAAYRLKGRTEEAMLVMNSHLSNVGLKKRYSAIYDNLQL